MATRTSNRICIALIVATALLIAYALACTAATVPLELADGSTLHLRAEEVNGRLVPIVLGEIPKRPLGDPMYYTREEKLSCFANMGNEVWRRVRDTQHKQVWVQGRIDAGLDVRWPREQRVVVWAAKDTSSVAYECIEVLAFSTGRNADPARIIKLYDGRPRFADEIRIWYGPVGDLTWARCDVVLAFPLGWRAEEVVEVEVIGGE